MERTEEILNKTLPFLKEAGKYSFSATAKVAGTLFSFSILNIFLLIFGFYYFFKVDYTKGHLYLLILMIIIGIISTVFACYKMYNFVVIDAARVYFEKIDDFKTRVAEKIIDKFEAGINDGNTVKKPVNQMINIVEVVTDLYGKVPKKIIKIFNFIVGKIPLVDFSAELKQHIQSGNKEKAVDHFVTKTNEFFQETIFSQNNTRLIYITLIANIVLQVVLIYFLKK